jgi:Rap1a immunity proteins
MGAVVVKYIRDNPKDRHLNAAAITALAFKDAWPCSPAEKAR